MDFADYLGCAQGFWELEAAAMLSQIGYLSLPADVVEKIYYGETLTPEERLLAQGVPEVAGHLLGRIPRLEPVLQILAALTRSRDKIARLEEGRAATAGQILLLITDFDELISQGHSRETAVRILLQRGEPYDTELAKSFATHLGASAGDMLTIEIPLRQVQPGMTILQDIRTELGTLLIARGFEVTERFTERIRNFGPGLLAEKIAVRVPAGHVPSSST